MKNANQSRSDRRLAFALALVALAMPSCHVNNGQTPADASTANTLVFEGTLEALGPDLGIPSGLLAVYRLAKYRVERVCEGKYEGREIVVDHLILTAKEFDGIHVNDRVCVRVIISKKIPTRYNAEGIRSPSDDVKAFYLADAEIKPIDGRHACCD